MPIYRSPFAENAERQEEKGCSVLMPLPADTFRIALDAHKGGDISLATPN
jgi:hypothetical protein